MYTKLFGKSPERAEALLLQSRWLNFVKEHRKALPLIREAASDLETCFGNNSPATLEAYSFVADQLSHLGQSEDAIELAVQIVGRTRKHLSKHHRIRLIAARRLVYVYRRVRDSRQHEAAGEALELTKAVAQHFDESTTRTVESSGASEGISEEITLSVHARRRESVFPNPTAVFQHLELFCDVTAADVRSVEDKDFAAEHVRKIMELANREFQHAPNRKLSMLVTLMQKLRPETSQLRIGLIEEAKECIRDGATWRSPVLARFLGTDHLLNERFEECLMDVTTGNKLLETLRANGNPNIGEERAFERLEARARLRLEGIENPAK